MITAERAFFTPFFTQPPPTTTPRTTQSTTQRIALAPSGQDPKPHDERGVQYAIPHSSTFRVVITLPKTLKLLAEAVILDFIFRGWRVLCAARRGMLSRESTTLCIRKCVILVALGSEPATLHGLSGRRRNLYDQ